MKVQIITKRVIRVKGRTFDTYKFDSLEAAREFSLKFGLEKRIIDIIIK